MARGEIATLQYGRGIAALLVCLYHFEGLTQVYFGNFGFFNIFRGGHSGVEFFFVLSGFIIYRAHRGDIGRRDKAGEFFIKRAIRVLPMYWFVVVPLGLTILSSSSLGADRALTLPTFLTDLFLIPRSGRLTLPPAWTLQFELVFYLVFSLAIVSRRLGLAALVLWQAICVGVLVTGAFPQNYLLPESKFFGYYNFGFAFGLAVAYLDDRYRFEGRRILGAACGLVALAGLVVSFVLEWRGADTVIPAAGALRYFALYSLGMVALLTVPNRRRPLLDGTLGVLGAASYVLYLSHEPVQSALFKVITRPQFHAWIGAHGAYLLSLLVAISLAIAIHRLIERPVLALLRRALLPPRPIMSPAMQGAKA